MKPNFHPSNYEDTYPAKLLVKSQLTQEKIEMDFTIYVISTQRSIEHKSGNSLSAFSSKPITNQACATFDNTELFKGSVFELNLVQNATTGKDVTLHPRVSLNRTIALINETHPEPTLTAEHMLVDKNFIYIINAKQIYIISLKNLKYKTMSLNLNATFSIQKCVLSPTSNYIVISSSNYNNEHTLHSYSGNNMVFATLQGTYVYIDVAEDDVLFAAVSHNYRSVKSVDDVFIATYDVQTMKMISEVKFSQFQQALKEFNFDNFELKDIKVQKKHGNSYDVIIVEEKQGLILCQVITNPAGITCQEVNVTKLVSRDIPGIIPKWLTAKIVNVTYESSDKRVFTLLLGATNYHSYMLTLTRSGKNDWSCKVKKGFMTYTSYQDTPLIHGDDRYLVALTNLPPTNYSKNEGQFLMFYDLMDDHSHVNIQGDNYTVVDAFQRINTSAFYSNRTIGAKIPANSHQLYTISMLTGILTIYNISKNNELCINNVGLANDRSYFVLEASNDYSTAVYRENFGYNWNHGTFKRWLHIGLIALGVLVVCLLIYGVISCVKKCRNRDRKSRQVVTDSIYREM